MKYVRTLGLALMVAALFTIGATGIPSIPKPPVPTPPPAPTVPKVPLPQVPGLDRLFSEESPITTGIADAVTSIPYLDGYTPPISLPLQSVPRDANGVFHLVPGSYWFEARSYCLHAGKHGPGQGDAYINAPLKGPRAPVIREILIRSASHLEIPQQTVQTLIWAVLARQKFSDMSPELQTAAAKLVSPAHILALNQGSVGFIPGDMQAQVFAKVPDALKPLFQAENSLRGLLSSNATYQDLERIAVPTQTHPLAGGPQVPVGRWSYDKNGFFVAYVPHGYPWTTQYLDVPGAVNVQRDAMGRIASLSDAAGNRVEARYDTTGSGAAISGDAQTHVYRINSMHVVWALLTAKGAIHRDATLNGSRFVVVGSPTGNGRVGAAGGASGQAAYDSAAKLATQFSALVKNIRGSPADVGDLVAVASFRDALTSLVGEHKWASLSVTHDVQLASTAWERALIRAAGGETAAKVLSGADPDDDPSSNVANPENTDRQRLSQSPNCHEPPANEFQRAMAVEFTKANVEPQTAGYPQRIAYTNTPGSGVAKFGIAYDAQGIPIAPCDPNYQAKYQYYIAGAVSYHENDSPKSLAQVFEGDRHGQTAEGNGSGNTANDAFYYALTNLHATPHH